MMEEKAESMVSGVEDEWLVVSNFLLSQVMLKNENDFVSHAVFPECTHPSIRPLVLPSIHHSIHCSVCAVEVTLEKPTKCGKDYTVNIAQKISICAVRIAQNMPTTCGKDCTVNTNLSQATFSIKYV